MENKKNSIEQVALRYGLLSALGLTAFFILMRIIGLHQELELRVLNFFILVAGIILSLRQFDRINEGNTSYFQGFALGALTSFVAVIPFTIFIFIYLQSDTAFMNFIINEGYFGQYLNPYILSFVIVIEGIFSGLLVTYTALQYMRRSHLAQNPEVIEPK